MTRLLYAVTAPATARTFLKGQLAHMAAQGHEVHLATGRGAESLTGFSEAEGCRWHPLPLERDIHPLKDLAALWQAWRLLRRVRPDAVVYGTPKASLIFAVAAWLAGIPRRLYLIHGFRHETCRGFRRALLEAMERLDMRLSTRILCVSHSILALAQTHLPEAAPRMALIAEGSCNGLDTVELERRAALRDPAALRASLGIPPGAVVLGFVGRWTRDKGLVELQQAFAWHLLQHPDTFLLMLGGPEAGDPVPPGVLKALATHPQVRQVGFQPNPGPWYRVMDVLVLPTHREGFPYVPLEAAALGLPVLTTEATGARDAVLDGETGLRVPVGDVGALAGAMTRLVEDPHLRTRLGERGRARVLSSFQADRVWRFLEHEVAGEAGLAPHPWSTPCES